MLQPSSEKTKLDKAYASFVQERGDSERMHWAHPLDEGPKGFALRALYADLTVMGGYGYSRNREWVMGGATRTVLHSMTLPVLMAH